MKIAIPVDHEELCMYFGRCNKFSIIDVDLSSKSIIKKKVIDISGNQPADVPKCLKNINVDMVIANRICQSTMEKFSKEKINLLYGARTKKPETLAIEYIDGNLYTSNNFKH
jgi:predicted Fe-Mo cluster-binding NifX family protein